MITSITPASANRGSTVKVEINLAARGARPPVPREAPNWFQVGPYKGANIKRRGNVVQAEITIPGRSTGGNSARLPYRIQDATRTHGGL